MKWKNWIYGCVSLIFLIVLVPGCKNTEGSVRKYERMEKKMMRAEEKSMDAARKDHLMIQSKATREMMRDAKKRARKLNQSKKR